MLAPTAGGKTEAALFPILSRMLGEDWRGLSVLYVCPIKALLNNLDARPGRYCTLLGRRSALWHGDVAASAKKRALFADFRAVIVDEIHAFAGDDRGWHLLSVLARIERLAGRELQRIGLSATVGNPADLVGWLAGSCRGPRRALLPPPGPAGPEPEVKLDHVGSSGNAAIVISRLHRGEKRLVFIDSRARAEELGALLRQARATGVRHAQLAEEGSSAPGPRRRSPAGRTA